MLSHELRTPLTAIIGYTELLRAGQFGAVTLEQYFTLSKVDTNAHRLREVVNTVLAISRIEADLCNTEHCWVNLAELMDEIANEVRTVWEKGLTFSLRVASDIPPLRTDPTQLKIVIKNLIDNAIKFTETGKVTVDIATHNEGIEIQVADTGIGISAHILPFIFEPFRQGEELMTRQHGGLGLGLYQAKRLVELLGGTIAVDSIAGLGSTFRVWLPTMKLHEERLH
jgi:signal transduction histidine kinase